MDVMLCLKVYYITLHEKSWLLISAKPNLIIWNGMYNCPWYTKVTTDNANNEPWNSIVSANMFTFLFIQVYNGILPGINSGQTKYRAFWSVQ